MKLETTFKIISTNPVTERCLQKGLELNTDLDSVILSHAAYVHIIKLSMLKEQTNKTILVMNKY